MLSTDNVFVRNPWEKNAFCSFHLWKQLNETFGRLWKSFAKVLFVYLFFNLWTLLHVFFIFYFDRLKSSFCQDHFSVFTFFLNVFVNFCLWQFGIYFFRIRFETGGKSLKKKFAICTFQSFFLIFNRKFWDVNFFYFSAGSLFKVLGQPWIKMMKHKPL